MNNTRISKNIIEIQSPGGEFGLRLSNFTRYYDDSGIEFKLFCRSSHFEIRNFTFYADFISFKTFLNKLKMVYEKLDGEAKIETSFEKDIGLVQQPRWLFHKPCNFSG